MGNRTAADARVAVAGAVGLCATAGVAAAWTTVRSSAPSVDAALVLVAVTTVVGLSGRRSAVIGAAAGAAGGFTFFDAAPYDKWAITRATDVVTTVLLLVVGLAAGEMALRVGRQRRVHGLADERLDRIREAARRLAEGEELVPMIGSVAAQLEAMFGLRACRFSTEGDDEDLPAISRDGAISRAPGPAVALPVQSMGAVVGRFVLEAGPDTGWARDQVIVAVTLADQVGAALAAQAPTIVREPEPPGDAPGPRLRVVR